ncbi:O-antigen ligase family protein [Streptomyces koyangensis]|uniref:O-antigen ligase family protein n=1 Tax=Streptomyces koyangensis TaxID=188770 RepID=A0ABX7EPA1_9ACTN|nr:O-antigen ligase family protein [Streptomyces koyangensis]
MRVWQRVSRGWARPVAGGADARFAGVPGLAWAGVFAGALMTAAVLRYAGAGAAGAVVAVGAVLLMVPGPGAVPVVLLVVVPVAAAAGAGGTVLLGMAGVATALTAWRLRAASGAFRPVLAELPAAGALIVLVCVSFLLPQTPVRGDRSWTEFLALPAGVLLAVVTACAAVSPRAAARALAATGTAVAVGLLLAGAYASERLTGLGLNPNYLGMYLASALVAAVGLAWQGRSPLWWAAALPCGVALSETGSRGAGLAALAGLVCLLLAGRPWRWQLGAVLAVGAAVLLVPDAWAWAQDLLSGGRDTRELTANTEVRGQVGALALQVASDHPLRGIGYGAFRTYAETAPGFWLRMNTHNDYLRLAAEAGAPALLAFAALLGRALTGRRPGGAPVLRAVCVTSAVGLLFANTLASPVVSVPFWVVLGCLLARPARAASSPGGVPDPAAQRSRELGRSGQQVPPGRTGEPDEEPRLDQGERGVRDGGGEGAAGGAEAGDEEQVERRVEGQRADGRADRVAGAAHPHQVGGE